LLKLKIVLIIQERVATLRRDNKKPKRTRLMEGVTDRILETSRDPVGGITEAVQNGMKQTEANVHSSSPNVRRVGVIL
jgi:hypothetical protein